MDNFVGARSPLDLLLVELARGGTTLGGPREVSDRDDEEAVAVVCDTSKGIVPGQERSKNTKDTAGLDETLLGSVGSGIGSCEISGTEAQECQIQGEEEGEEGNGGLERADKQDGGEDEPAL